MNQNMQRLLTILVVIALGVAIFVALTRQPELLLAIRNITLLQTALLTLVRLGIFAMNGLFLREFTYKFGVKLKFNEWFGLAAITTMGNYLTPFSGGVLIRAAYLKKKHQLPYAEFTALLASNYLITFWLIGVIGLITMWVLGYGWQAYWPIIALFALVVGGISLVLLIPIGRIPLGQWDNRVTRFVKTLLDGWQMVRQDYWLLFKLALLTFLTIWLNALSFWIAYWSLGVIIPFSTALLLGLVAAFSIFINLTPGSLGVQEAMVALSSELLGEGSGLGLLAVLLIRATTILLAFTLGPIYSLLLSRYLGESDAHQTEE